MAGGHGLSRCKTTQTDRIDSRFSTTAQRHISFVITNQTHGITNRLNTGCTSRYRRANRAFKLVLNGNLTRCRGAKRLSPFTIPSFLVNLAAGQVSIKHQFKGPIGAPVTACAAGVQAIGDAVRLIRNDEADVALCGGAEAAIDTVSLGGFAAAKAMSSGHTDHPEKASRPFDSARDGFVMGEGAGMLVIEELEHAKARGANILAEIVGYGTSGDAYHMTSGAEDGNGAGRAM